MSQTITPATRSFACDSCKGEIQIPFDLPPTTGPCPLCKATITSPPPPDAPIKLTPEPGPGSILPLNRSAPPVSGVVPKESAKGPPPVEAKNNRGEAPRGRSGSDPGGAAGISSANNLIAMPGKASSGEGAGAAAGEAKSPVAKSPVAKSPVAKSPVANAVVETGAKTKRKIHPAIPFLAAIVLIVGVLVGLVMLKRKDPEVGPLVVEPAPSKEKVEEARRIFVKDGWKTHSTDALTGFLRADTLESKAGYIIGGEDRLEEMRKFYVDQDKIDESDTPIELFSHFDLDIADKKRGLFLMQFERPSQYDIKEFFRPVAPLEVQHKLEDPGLLLSAFAARENFAMEPMRVMAFFREVDNKLLLDWDVYAQTKYRTLRHYVSHPQPGASKVFRVMAREIGPPDLASADVSVSRQFRFSDPAHGQDAVDVSVESDSTVGKILADLAFINIPDKEPQNRYATVELAWTEEEDPEVVLRDVICWEFLNLGGVAGNAVPVEIESSPVELEDLGADPLAPPVEGGSPAPVTTPLDPAGESLPGEEDVTDPVEEGLDPSEETANIP